MLNGIDLFSGIGGISLALSEWVRPVAYCEQDRYCQGVLMSRMSRGDLPAAPIWNDVRSLRGGMFSEGSVDIVYGGFPCQDISNAGARAGLAGERSGLFKEIVRLTSELCPGFVFLENVAAIVTRGLPEVLTAFAELGYDTRWTCLRASDVGAPHQRNRWWLLAHANGAELRHEQGGSSGEEREGAHEPRNDGETEYVADSERMRELQSKGIEQDERRWSSNGGWWASEPNVGRVADGVPFRVDRIRGLGNAVVPVQAKEAFIRLMGIRECKQGEC